MTKEDLETIYNMLLKNGAGHALTEMVFQEDSMFTQCIMWIKEGISEIEIANRVQEEWLKKNPNATQHDLDPYSMPSVKQLAGLEKWPSEERAKELINYRYKKERQKSTG